MIIYLVCDISGSMSENGKHLITRGAVRSIEQYCRLGYGNAEFKLIVWNEQARIIEWNTDDEFPQEMHKCEGAANVKSLIQLLEKQPAGKFIIITDGFYTSDDVRAFKRWKNSLSPDTLRIIRIGSDADTQLKGDDVFIPENIFDLLNNWIEEGTL